MVLIAFGSLAQAKDYCLGTFSSFRYNSEAGDLLGIEIRIANTADGKQAVVQFSEGEPGQLQLARVTCEGTKISIKAAGDGSKPAFAFNGLIFADRLTGELAFNAGGRERITLERRASYWERKQ